MTLQEAQDVIASMRYPRGRFEVRVLNPQWYGDEMYEVKFSMRSRDVYDRKQWVWLVWTQKLSGIMLSRMDKSGLTNFAFQLVRNVVDHEMKEWFTVEGKNVYNPHRPIVLLNVEVAGGS